VWPPELDLRAEHLALRQRGVRPPQSAAPPESFHGASLPHIGDGGSVKDQGATPSSVDARSSDVAPSAQGGEQHPISGLDRVRGGSVAGKAQQRHMVAPRSRGEVRHNSRSHGANHRPGHSARFRGAKSRRKRPPTALPRPTSRCSAPPSALRGFRILPGNLPAAP